MVFSSTLFLFFFLPVTLAGYFLIRESCRNYWLLIVSLIFFSWSQPEYLWLILLNIAVNYSCALLADKVKSLRKPVLVTAMSVNLGILFYYKYYNFVLDSINKLSGSDFVLHNIVLPVGISFFTFQGMSYVIDVYRRTVPVQKNILKVALYIMLFPQLIAGPIVRYQDIAGEIDRRNTTLEDVGCGVERFIIGLAKKAILANTLAAMADAVWKGSALNQSAAVVWGGSIAYTLQIYFDFSGYSDMAVGLGRIFGFHFNDNFNLPYTSKSITEFWRRWHISLSSWFRDYVYIPLGGNRRHVYLNLAVVFWLTGVWHGASWHFIAWGVWNGFFILVERFIREKTAGRRDCAGRKDAGIKGIFLRIYTLLVVHLGWVLFRAPHTRDALEYVQALFGLTDPAGTGFTLFWYLDRWTITVMAAAVFFSTAIPGKLACFLRGHIPETVFAAGKYILLLCLLYLSMMRIVSGTYNPFIYFQF